MLVNQRGYILPLVLICSTLMIALVSSTSKILIGHQKSINNHVDIKLAEMYAYETIKYAESYVYHFDLIYQLENPNISCNEAATKLGIPDNKLAPDNCLNIRRGAKLHKLINMSNDGQCSKGFCYKLSKSSIYVINTNFSSDYTWKPWELVSSPLHNATKPCNWYVTQHKDKQVTPLIDNKAGVYSIVHHIGDTSLCAQPRFIFEPINLDYRGTYLSDNTSDNDIYYLGKTSNHDSLIMYKVKRNVDTLDSILINSARLYRITVVTFGKHGDTKVILQSIIMINNHDSNNPRTIGDNEEKRQNRIVRLSMRLFHDK